MYCLGNRLWLAIYGNMLLEHPVTKCIVQVTGYGWLGKGDANDVWRVHVKVNKLQNFISQLLSAKVVNLDSIQIQTFTNTNILEISWDSLRNFSIIRFYLSICVCVCIISPLTRVRGITCSVSARRWKGDRLDARPKPRHSYRR